MNRAVTLRGGTQMKLITSAIATIIGVALGNSIESLSFAESPPNVLWSRDFGAIAGNTWTYAVAVDQIGNSFAGGFTEGSLSGPYAGNTDAFLTKFDAKGNTLWSQQLGTNRADQLWDIATDLLDNAYVAGSTSGNLAGTSSGGLDAFLIKYDAAGAQLWKKQFGSIVVAEVTALDTDSSGAAYYTVTTQVGLAGSRLGGYDGALFKFDESGNVLWSTQFGTEGDEHITAVAADENLNSYVSGWRGSNAFLYKFDPNGSPVWSETLDGIISNHKAISIATDAVGNLYMTGFTDGDLGGPNVGNDDSFIIKFAPDGSRLWARQLGTPYDDISNAIAVGPSGEVTISGYTQGVLGDTSEGAFTDVFLADYNGSGELLWTRQFSGAGFESANAIAINSMGNIFIGGSQGSFTQGAFITKFVVPEPPLHMILAIGTLTICSRPHRRRNFNYVISYAVPPRRLPS